MSDLACVIVGGGVVGATLALSLSQCHVKVGLLEKEVFQPSREDFCARTLALSYSSVLIYQALGIWDQLKIRAVPIQEVLVTVKGQYGSSRLNQQNDHPLGFVISSTDLEAELYRALKKMENVTVFRPAILATYQHFQDRWELCIQDAKKKINLSTKLLISAEGGASLLRAQQAIAFNKKEYGHHAIITNVQIQSLKSFRAYERFLPDGAIALIPWQKNYATCILTTNAPSALMALNDKEYLQTCQHAMGMRIGKFLNLSQRICLPLSMQIASQQKSARFLLIGNAAHSLHPIAAQGLNLSLRDVWQLCKQLLNETKTEVDMGCENFLNDYVQARKSEQTRIIFATDKIAQFMSSGFLPPWIRSMGVTLFDCLPLLKTCFTESMMGVTH